MSLSVRFMDRNIPILGIVLVIIFIAIFLLNQSETINPLTSSNDKNQPINQSSGLMIDTQEWFSFTADGTSEKAVRIFNPSLESKEVEAKVNWISQQNGIIQLESFLIKEDEEKTNPIMVVLNEDYQPVSLGPILPNQTALLVLTLIPDELTVDSPKSTFEIEFIEKGNNKQKKVVYASITHTREEECLSFIPDIEKGAVIEPGELSTSFEINRNESCGGIVFEVKLCSEFGNENCSGGTANGLNLSHWDFNLEKSQTIQINKIKTGSNQTIPGQYGITIQVRTPNTDWKKIGEYPVIVKPQVMDSTNFFDLERYKLYLPQAGSTDSFTLTNYYLAEKVEVKACAKAWLKAVEKDEFMGEDRAPFIGTPQDDLTFFDKAVFDDLNQEKAYFKSRAEFTSVKDSWDTFPRFSRNIFGKTLGNIIAYGIGIWATIIVFIVDLIIDIVGDILSGIFVGVYLEDSCFPIEFELADFVTNLSGTMGGNQAHSSDFISASVDDPLIQSVGQLSIANVKNSETGPTQQVGLIFSRTSDESQLDSYATLTIQAREHIHGENESHYEGESKVDCENDSDFGIYDISCDEKIKVRTEKFHIQIKKNNYPIANSSPTSTGNNFCQVQGKWGKTGKEAVPKIKLNWSWNDQTGINLDTCDAKNPNAVYCDATQFTIMIAKRIKEMDNVLQKNNYFQNVCPKGLEVNSTTDSPNFGLVPMGKVGAKSLSYRKVSNKVFFDIEIENNTTEVIQWNQSVSVYSNQIKLVNQCETGIQLIESETTKTITCEVDAQNWENGAFYVAKTFEKGMEGNPFVERNPLTIPIYFAEVIDPNNCDWPKMTAEVGDNHIIEDYFNELPQFAGTSTTPSIENVRELIQFEAYLMRDQFTTDFMRDFTKQYRENSILEAPEWFTQHGLGDLFENNQVIFTQFYEPNIKVNVAGKYKVSLYIQYPEDWKMFTKTSNPTRIVVALQLIEPANPYSIFYDLPLNGNVGRTDKYFERDGYGVYFESSDLFSINNNPDSPTTLEGIKSGIQLVQLQVDQDFEKLNQSKSKGLLMKVIREEDQIKWNVSPSFATPVIAIIDAKKSEEPVSAYYQIFENISVTTFGDSLINWNSMSLCKDFDEKKTRFQKKDRLINQFDPFGTIPKGYALDWDKVSKEGKVWFTTVLFSPISKDYTIMPLSKNIQLSAPTNNQVGNGVKLQGIMGLTNNYKGENSQKASDNLQTIFDLVESSNVCVIENEHGQEYFWNLSQLTREEGEGTSVNKINDHLITGGSCIN